MKLKLTFKSNNLILTYPGRWSFAAGLEHHNRILQKESVAWIDNHNIYQRLTTMRLCWLVAFSLSRSTTSKADVLAVGRWKWSQSNRR